MGNADNIFIKIVELVSQDSPIELKDLAEQLKAALQRNLYVSRRGLIISRLCKLLKDDRSGKILDFGCGAGQTVIYLRLLGFDAKGVDLGCVDLPNKVASKLGLGVDTFIKYSGHQLPDPNENFRLVFSEQVLEHVMDLPTYYSEAHRVLMPDGIAYFSFPHRLIPYDTHTRTWMIHYFPSSIRYCIYGALSHNITYIKSILNYRTVGTHRKLGLAHFASFQDITAQRLLEGLNQSLASYEGIKSLRRIANAMIRMPVIGGLMCIALSKLANADVIFKK